MTLSEMNQRCSPAWLSWPLTIAIGLLAGVFFIAHTRLQHSLVDPPAVGGDSPDYDCIAWQLSQGHGFQRDFSDSEFRRPYIEQGTDSQLMTLTGPVTDRPPLYPVLMAAANCWAGRQFWVIRVIQAGFSAMVIALGANLVYKLAGLFPALLTAGLYCIVDWRTRWSVREILTESLACFLVMLLYLTMIRWMKSGGLRWGVLAGLVCGLTILCRTMMIMWLPVIALAVICYNSDQQRNRRLFGATLFTVCALLVCLPVWNNNIQVLGSFHPLGLQGAEQMSAAYSDEAWARKGMWFNLDDQQFFSSIQESDPIQRALARADYSQQQAGNWIRHHPLQAVLLWPARVVQEFRPHGPGELFILAFALLGLALLANRQEGAAGWTLLLAQVLAVAATWSVAGRFVIPLLGVLHPAAGIGLWSSLVMLCERRQQSREVIFRHTPPAPAHS